MARRHRRDANFVSNCHLFTSKAETSHSLFFNAQGHWYDTTQIQTNSGAKVLHLIYYSQSMKNSNSLAIIELYTLHRSHVLRSRKSVYRIFHNIFYPLLYVYDNLPYHQNSFLHNCMEPLLLIIKS